MKNTKPVQKRLYVHSFFYRKHFMKNTKLVQKRFYVEFFLQKTLYYEKHKTCSKTGGRLC